MANKLAENLYWLSAIVFIAQLSFIATTVEDGTGVPWQYVLMCSATFGFASALLVARNWNSPFHCIDDLQAN